MEYKNFEILNNLITTLRGENGCPWDRKQTPATMGRYMLEEVYELLEAIESGNPDEICEELGDVFFHILFIARLFQEKEIFGIEDVACKITEKMIHRHPHVFGNEKVNSADEVRVRWHKIKMKEKNTLSKKSVLDSVPAGLPALMRAYTISERAAKTGFDWDNISGVMEKTEEELAELKAELSDEKENQKNVAMEFGDLLFSLVNLARFANIHPETALTDSIRKFEKRFKYMENIISESGRNLETVSMSEMDSLWEEAKKMGSEK